MKKEATVLIVGIAIGSISTMLVFKDQKIHNADSVHDEAALKPSPQPEDPVEREELLELRQEVADLTEKLSDYEATEASRQSEQNAEKAKYIEFALQRYKSLFELSFRQKELIGELEWESKQFWQDARAGKIDMSKAELPDLDGNISRILTQDQNRIYQKHLISKKDSSTQLASTALLSQVPVTLNLSDEQQDEIYKNLYVSLHPDTQSEFKKRWEATDEHEFDKTRQMIVWSAEEALSEELLEKLKQAFKK